MSDLILDILQVPVPVDHGQCTETTARPPHVLPDAPDYQVPVSHVSASGRTIAYTRL